MTKERAEKIADMLGVELGEMFCVKFHRESIFVKNYQCENEILGRYFEFTKDGLFLRYNTDKELGKEWGLAHHWMFVDLITGEADVIKLDKRYRPLKNDTYFVPNPIGDNDNTLYIARRWEESYVDLAFYDKHMTFRIPEEARDMALRMVGLAMYGEDNNEEDED